MSINKNVPEIRFKGFGGDWLEHKLEQITDVYDGTHQTPQYTSDGVMFLSAENIRSLTSNKFISRDAFKRDFKVYPQMNDVLMTRIGDVGTANVVETNNDKAFYVTLALLKYKYLSPYFLKNSISSPFVQKDIWLRTLHIAFPKKINMNEIKKISIRYPSDFVESEKIGNYFQKLDNLINQHQQKHDKLINIKKAMLEKMFPKQGETVPEIRFKGFSGDWFQRSLGDATTITMGQSPKGENYTNNPRDFILVQGNADLKNGFVAPRIWTREITKTAKKGDLIFSVRAPVGEVGITNYSVVLGRGVASITGNRFIHQQLKKLKAENYWYVVSAGSTFDSISSNELASTQIWITCESEQTAIGNYFQTLDNLINQHQQQITKLNNIKQACLSKMFV